MPDTPHVAPPPAPSDAVEGYRPISGLAIAALAVSILTAVIVTAVGVASKLKGKAILAPPIVLLALLGLALSLVARWQIRRSEGTRAGLGAARRAPPPQPLAAMRCSAWAYPGAVGSCMKYAQASSQPVAAICAAQRARSVSS